MRQFGKTIIEYETELRELAEFVLELSNSEEYLCSKFEEGLTLEIRKKMSVSGDQSYKEVVQLVLGVEKLTGERMSQRKFQKRRDLDLCWDSYPKRVVVLNLSVIYESQTDSASSPQTFRSPQPSKLGTSPPSSTFRGRMMSERCPRYNQFHSGVCSMPQ